VVANVIFGFTVGSTIAQSRQHEAIPDDRADSLLHTFTQICKNPQFLYPHSDILNPCIATQLPSLNETTSPNLPLG
jgi:hypothetical protein